MRVSLSDLSLWMKCRRQFILRDQHNPWEDLVLYHGRREAARVRAQARRLFPEAVRIDPHQPDAVERTRAACAAQEQIVDAVYWREPLRVVIEALRPGRKQSGWQIELFRAATGVRGSYIDDAAAILWALAADQLPIGDLHLNYLDKEYRRTAELDPQRLFRQSTLTSRARKRIGAVEAEIEELCRFLDGSLTIDLEHYRCTGRCEQCFPPLRELDRTHVLTLHKGADLGRLLTKDGVEDIREIPETAKLNAKQRIQREAVRTGEPHIDQAKLERFLTNLRYPVHFLDFEAFTSAVPPFAGLTPFAHCPVVASVQRMERPPAASDTPEVHASVYVARPGFDDRAAMFSWLREVLGDEGSVVVFGRNFETAMIGQLAQSANAGDVGTVINSRVVDLLLPFNDFALYHPDQKGKLSLKRVLPALTGVGYEAVAVQDGMQANVSYARRADQWAAANGDDLAREVMETDVGAPQAATLDEIADYCATDTMGMVRVLSVLYRYCFPA